LGLGAERVHEAQRLVIFNTLGRIEDAEGERLQRNLREPSEKSRMRHESIIRESDERMTAKGRNPTGIGGSKIILRVGRKTGEALGQSGSQK